MTYQNFQKLNIEKNYEEFTNASSMFIVYKKPSEEGAMNIDLDSDYIKIGLNKKEYAVYELNNKNSQMQPILNAMVIFPALIYVFEELKQYGEDKIDYTGRKWYKSLVKSYQKRGENFEAKIESEPKLSTGIYEWIDSKDPDHAIYLGKLRPGDQYDRNCGKGICLPL